MNWYLKVLKEHYADFNGRAGRKEYWTFVLFSCIALIAVTILDVVQGRVTGAEGVLIGLYFIATIVPSIALGVRRMHDINRSGWYLLLSFIPIISIIVLVWAVTEGDKGPNQYGADPKGVENGSVPSNPFE